MQRRSLWLLIGLLCIGALVYFWRAGGERRTARNTPSPSAAAATNTGRVSKSQTASPFHLLSGGIASQGKQSAANGNVSRRLEYRLSNTIKTVGQLAQSDSGILLANALIDTAESAKVEIPEHLRAPDNNGSYIVQAKGPVDAAFRTMLQSAGATIISYVPNNAFLVRLSDTQAGQLSGNSLVQKVLSYEPYYKLDPGLLKLAVEQTPLPDRAALKLTVFPGTREDVLKTLAAMGARVSGEERSPFGPVITAQVGSDSLVELARNSAVQLIETSQPRVSANDLTRVSLRISADAVTNVNYLDLTGSNILVNLNDTGVDQFHPDLTNRVFGDSLNSLVDTVGHGTHVAGTIAGSGISASLFGTNGYVKAPGSLTNASFRGMAHAAKLYSLTLDSFRGPNSDTYLQEQAALTNAFISNNSWGYANTFEYSIEAASYDAAVRDTLPDKVGSQPVLFIFSAGNSGNGEEGGLNGDPDSILSPGTAKNVITVGALEQERNITNLVSFRGETNAMFQPGTDRKDQVAYYSSRGNTGIGIEGEFGRFKPDVVAPGSFLVSARSGQWDTNAYYNPTNFTFHTFTDQSVEPGSLYDFPPLFIPDNAVGVIINVFPNRNSPSPFPDAPVYVRYGAVPTVNNFELMRPDHVTLPDDGLDVRQEEYLFYSVGNPTNVTFNFNVETILVLTNESGDYYTVLKGLNDDLGPDYRYSSGTSMAAGGVSGMMALMQEFFEQRLHMTNSPALMKALLINGSRSAGSLYNLQVDNFINFQGWGLPSLPNSIPLVLTNLTGQTNFPVGTGLPMQFYDQHPTNALATGERKTRTLTPTPAGRARPLRVTLVWTDPPGNPSVGIKLVNDLDLVVTNLSTGEVYFGNDIPAGSDFNQSWDTNSPVKNDFVNNVENVFLPAPLGTNYSITVIGKRVNVNATTGNTNNVVQDYALVISSGNGDVTNAFTITETPVAMTNNQAHVTTVTNAVPLFGQRVGGNSQYSGTTNGVLGQWNFYEYTNTNNFTNVAFLTFLPPELGVPRIGTREMDPFKAGRIEADVDLFVSTDPSLIDLNPVAIANAYRSHTRSGTETILLNNSSLGQKYYIGVKSEDQQGAEYTFFAAASEKPFGQRDPNGNIIVTMLPPFQPEIPDGSPSKPGRITVIGVTSESDAVRRVVVTNEVTHQNFGDLVGTLSHDRKFAVLNNHSYFDSPTATRQQFIYDDSEQGDIENARPTDGPGSLRKFVGEKASGSWILTMVDDSQSQTGRVEFTGITLEPQSPTNNVKVTLGARSYWADFIDVEPGATNLTVSISITGPDGLQLMLRRGDFPTLNIFDKKAFINPPGGSLSITKYDSPPLNPGRYYILVYNPNLVPVTFNISKTLQYDLLPIQPFRFISDASQPIPDDAVSYFTNRVGVNSRVVSAEVGVRIDHPRISDLVLTLISPQGTRVLLAENRGGLDTNGYGAGVNITNVLPQFTSGGATAKTNLIPVTQTAGTLLINYEFFVVPDSMHIYYDGVRIFDSGYVSGSGNFVVDFGPGISTDVVVVMNEGNNAAIDTEWNYSLTVITRAASYATFTENTNYTDVPIKFATPPFGSTNATTPAVNLFAAGFDTTPPGIYTAPTAVDGWTLGNTNPVTVVEAPALADTGNNVLALHNGSISRVLPTIPGKTYTLTFVTRGQPVLDPVSWWKAETNLIDSADGNNATVTRGSLSYLPGVVGAAFNITNTQLRVANDPVNLRFTNNFSIESWLYCRNLPGPAAILYKSDARAALDPYTVAIAPGGPPGFGNLSFSVADEVGATASLAVPFPLNQFAHFGCTFTNGLMSIYTNGILAGQLTTTVRPFPALQPAQDPGIGIGNVGDYSYNAPFQGLIDEMSLYNRPLTEREVQSIYAAGSAGKCPVGGCSVLADVTLSGNNNVISATDAWVTNIYTFTAVSNGTVFSITPRTDGLLVDSFNFIQNPFANPTNYFFPEESLAKLQGEKSQGDWILEILDNRVGGTNPAPNLVSWELNLVLDSLVPAAQPLTHGSSQTNTVNPNEIKYFIVDVPLWARFATNQLINPTGPLNVWFNQSVLPTGTNGGDILLMNGSTGGSVTLAASGGTPILVPGERYYIGVQNLGAVPVTFSFQVDFDITQLFNAAPRTSTLAALGEPRYYFYDVSTNAQAVVFEIFNANGNVDLVARKGLPLPDLVSHEYISASLGTNPESIVIITNSQPVALSPGRWYLGVFNNDILPVTYTIMATESGPPTIIDLTNGVPFTYTAGPGAALTNFFRFVIDQTNSAALFELYDLSGDVDLTLKRGALPYTAPYTGFSFNAGTANEQIVIRSSTLSTDLNGQWFLAVPNRDVTTVTYTIRAVVSTNGVLTSGVPSTVQITVPPPATPNGPTLTWPAIDGETYEVQTSTDLVTWTVEATRVASGNTVVYVDPTPITGIPVRFYRIVQVPGP